MKKVLLLIFFAISCPAAVRAQHYFSISGKLTYNFLSVNGLKDLQEKSLYQLNKTGLAARAVDSFRPHNGMQVQLLFPIMDSARISIGVFIEQFSTGGRIDYRDFSGEIRFDQILDSRAFGLMGEKKFDLNSYLTCSLSLGISMIESSYEEKTFEQLFGYTHESSLEFTHSTVGFTPGLALSLHIYKFSLSGSIGYQASLEAGFKYKGEPVKNLNDGSTLSPGINGFKLGLGLGLDL